MSTQLHYHSVYRRLSLAARQLQWSVTLLYCHTLCRGLAVSLTLLCRLSISHLTTSRSAKGQVGPSTYKRGGDICNPRSQPHSCSNTMHACMQSDQPHVMHMTLYQSHHISPSSDCIHQPVASSDQSHRASTKSRLNSHQRSNLKAYHAQRTHISHGLVPHKSHWRCPASFIKFLGSVVLIKGSCARD
jgi:hypothetical protein